MASRCSRDAQEEREENIHQDCVCTWCVVCSVCDVCCIFVEGSTECVCSVVEHLLIDMRNHPYILTDRVEFSLLCPLGGAVMTELCVINCLRAL
ncbi:uncharacterized [Tachysurus ichikawai]